MSKRKKTKKKKPQLPPISFADKSIYRSIQIFSVLLIVFFFCERMFFAEWIRVRDSSVIAVASAVPNILTGIIAIVYLLIVFAFTKEKWVGKKNPIFGNPDITYGNPAYQPVYPLFDKRYSKRKRKFRLRLTLYIIFFIITAAVLLGAFLHVTDRMEMRKDGSVMVHSIWEKSDKVYSEDDISKFTLGTEYDSGGRYSIGRWYIYFQFTMSDNEHYRFTIGDFTSREECFDEIEKMKMLVGNDKVSIIGKDNLAKALARGRFTPEEKERLYELFE